MTQQRPDERRAAELSRLMAAYEKDILKLCCLYLAGCRHGRRTRHRKRFSRRTAHWTDSGASARTRPGWCASP